MPDPNQNYGIDPLAGPSMPWDKTLSPVKKWFKVLAITIAIAAALTIGVLCVLEII